MARYLVNEEAVNRARTLIESRQYVLDSDWGARQPDAATQNDFLSRHSWTDYAAWHLALTDGATDETKARYAFVYGDFRRVHRTALIACVYRASEGGTSWLSSQPTTCCSISTGLPGSVTRKRKQSTLPGDTGVSAFGDADRGRGGL